ncbi:MAG: DUF4199 domain-containing protein [Prevotella sp.]|uniref:DUF4199 domain-containing protein n=1 Tax=Prevotella sp. TaxID=59823 RepID=UPI002A32E9CA|nr:DUF4199 domain-containing protein [Prevotella sp.]MDD7318742.1 DUF4199 domain-containing protein [Prevotellaceae bacterium]MDY4019302.1 DUF4199 domain-containing protein [Prevotella sp.]
MTTSEEYARIKARSRIDGALVGIMWAVSFLFTVAGFDNPSWSFAAITIGIASPFYGLARMVKFRKVVLGDAMSFRHALGYALMMMLCAALIFAGVQLVYFQFIDGGYFLEHYGNVLRSPEMTGMLGSYGLSEQDVESTMTVLSEMRPVEIVIQFLSGNVLLSAVLSLPLALLARKGGRGSVGSDGHDGSTLI